ncbi:hypothetical protein VHEMI03141 [[Torrubiella] hemipterigena]|uniref:Saccharopine dehydrogenase NADP binding domain-containing protein n=1 Tax=[Torrubiella] hemipterigena TaxID=1531966 RepID=A0A0A1TCK6_9HYPO|nr:hypothetical protein VHEMI03141 [[Torrubiella] hemipterigena]
MTSRTYDVIVFGATGYLGPLISRYLSANAPDSLRWAVAGRDSDKLHNLCDYLQEEFPQRKAPAVLVATLDPCDLDRLASSTRLVLNLVGPFSKYGTPVIKACIRNSTAYVDSTGEHTWSHEIATTLHDEAVSHKAPIIPHCAIECAPPDIMTHLLVKKAREANLVPAGPVYFSIDHTWPGYSGGTIVAILGVLSSYSLSQMNASSAPLASCVSDAGPNTPPSVALLPVRYDSFLGPLTFNPSAMADRSVVMRTWSLLQRYGSVGEKYGERFMFQGYARTSNLVNGWLSFIGTSLMTLFVVFVPPLQRFLASIAPAPGTGPHVDETDKHYVEWRAILQASSPDESKPSARITGVLRMEKDVYSCCAVLVGEAALSVLEVLDHGDSTSLVGKLQGGVLTPAAIGATYIDRLQRENLHVVIDLKTPGGGKP